MIPEFAAFGSPTYCLVLTLLAASRGCDLFSTWLATPHLVLEANPIARRLGWRWGLAVNAVVCAAVALWPLPAVVIMTTSVLVAARNLQGAWLMRTLGEGAYRSWMASRLAESRRGLFLFCLLAQAGLIAAVGGALIGFSQWQPVPLAIGTGIVAYAIAVVFFSMLSVRRIWRAGS